MDDQYNNFDITGLFNLNLHWKNNFRKINLIFRTYGTDNLS